MKIKKKIKEENVLKKRNTALLTFAVIAIIPLLFSFVIGFNLGNSNTVNDANRGLQLIILQQRLDSVLSEQFEVEEGLNRLFKATVEADSIFEKFESEDFKDLEDRLDRSSDEVSIHRWNNDRETLEDDLATDIQRLRNHIDFSQNIKMDLIFDQSLSWLNENAAMKGEYLYSIMINKKQEMGVDVKGDLQSKIEEKEDEIDELKSLLLGKDSRISGLMDDVQDSEREGRNKEAAAQKDLGTGQDQIGKLEETMKELETKNKTISSGIISGLDAIRSELPNLTGQKVLQWKNNEAEIQEFKANLELKLLGIERAALSL